MKKIKINPPIYDSKSGLLKFVIENSDSEKSLLKIDFKHLYQFASNNPSISFDLFILFSCVYGVDRFIKRKRKDYSINGWSRELNVLIPAHNVDELNLLKEDFEKLFNFLTGDYWNIKFYEIKFNLLKTPINKKYKDFHQINLFSGGLDSLIGAIDFLSNNPKKKLLLISHFDSNMHHAKQDQNNILPKLSKQFPKQFLQLPSVNISLIKYKSKETTFRSRSIMFIGIALLVSQGLSLNKIIVPENGTVSLNYPLSKSRRSSCSTRTTHPEVINQLLKILKKLKINIEIENPYEFNTKGEMVKLCTNQSFLLKILNKSNSCGKRGHVSTWKKQGTHCGRCMPCIYRRASLLGFKDTTIYGNEITDINLSKQSGRDLNALLKFLNTNLDKREIKNELIINGIQDINKLERYAELIINTREELRKFVEK